MSKKIITLIYDSDTDTTTILKSKTLEDCPASECSGEECECGGNQIPDELRTCAESTPHEERECCLHGDCPICNPKPNDSLEEKLHELFFSEFGWDCTEIDKDVKTVAQIAKTHYQEHPDELDTGIVCGLMSMKQAKEYFQEHPEELDIANHWMIKYKMEAKKREGMVSIDEVLRVFDEAVVGTPTIMRNCTNHLRKAIEKLGEKK